MWQVLARGIQLSTGRKTKNLFGKCAAHIAAGVIAAGYGPLILLYIPLSL